MIKYDRHRERVNEGWWIKEKNCGAERIELNTDMDCIFEWDKEKAKRNRRDHKVSFEEGRTVFGDPFSITIPDPEHSDGEERYIDIGESMNGRLLVVVYTEYSPYIRIISCRKATRKERKIYEEGAE